MKFYDVIVGASIIGSFAGIIFPVPGLSITCSISGIIFMILYPIYVATKEARERMREKRRLEDAKERLIDSERIVVLYQ